MTERAGWTMIRGSLLAAMLAVVAGALAASAPPAQAQTGVSLHSPWSLVAVTQAGPVDEILGGPGRDAVFAWEAAGERFETWRAAAPSAVNSLQNVAPGQGVWVQSSAPGSLEQAPAEGPVQVSVLAGFNLLGWTGADTPAPAVAELLGASILIGWSGEEQAFQRFTLSAPSVLNSLQTIAAGAGFWALIGSAGTVTLPGAGETLPGPDPEPDPDPDPGPEGLVDGEVTLTASDGVNLAADILVGSNIWVLFAHQNGMSRVAWEDIPEQVHDKGYTTLAWDFRGFGDSDPGSLGDLTRDWQAAIDFAADNGAQQIVAVGASMGGTSAIAVAASDARVVGLVLISAPAVFAGIDALAAAPVVTVPAFFAAGDTDGDAAADAQAMADAVGGSSQTLILPTALHGNALAASPIFEEQIVDALTAFIETL